MIAVTVQKPWLRVDLGREMQVLSFAPYRPGLVTARHILWREVRDEDLTKDFDSLGWLAGEVGETDAVAMLTSRDVGTHDLAEAVVEGVRATCVATVGLSNAERVGSRLKTPCTDYGTINIAVVLEQGLAPSAMIEAVSIATQARTVAVLKAGLRLDTGIATGTGTDCIAVAAPAGNTAFAGLHTPVGEAVGKAVLDAVGAGVRRWMATFGKGA